MVPLFHRHRSLRFYPKQPSNCHPLLDRESKVSHSAHTQLRLLELATLFYSPVANTLHFAIFVYRDVAVAVAANEVGHWILQLLTSRSDGKRWFVDVLSGDLGFCIAGNTADVRNTTLMVLACRYCILCLLLPSVQAFRLRMPGTYNHCPKTSSSDTILPLFTGPHTLYSLHYWAFGKEHLHLEVLSQGIITLQINVNDILQLDLCFNL